MLRLAQLCRTCFPGRHLELYSQQTHVLQLDRLPPPTLHFKSHTCCWYEWAPKPLASLICCPRPCQGFIVHCRFPSHLNSATLDFSLLLSGRLKLALFVPGSLSEQQNQSLHHIVCPFARWFSHSAQAGQTQTNKCLRPPPVPQPALKPQNRQPEQRIILWLCVVNVL